MRLRTWESPSGLPVTLVVASAGYEGFTHGSWAELATTAPRTAEFMELLFRMFGTGNVEFALLAMVVAATVGNTIADGAPMTYDRIVGAIGPFEMLEYVGIALIYGALAVTAPLRRRDSAPNLVVPIG
jgi:hypothetical protein